MKKVLKWLGIVFGGIVLLIVIASVAIMFIVDEKMIAGQMEKTLNRHVTIGNISVGIFSVLSGIEVKDVKISNFKTPDQLKALEGKPVDKGDVFVGLKAFKFKVKFLPLLSKRFELKELMLYEPVINVVKGKNGGFNFDDLTRPKKMTAEEKAELEKKKAEEAKKKAEAPKEPAKPLTADDIPVEISIGKIGMQKGVVTYVDQMLDQTFQIYNLTVMVHSIDIAPKELEKRDSVGLKIEMGIKTMGKVKSGSVESFDMGFSINGKVIPFDKKTRKLDPEVAVKAGMPYGKMTGLQIFEKVKSVDALSKYCGKMEFLSKEMEWKNAFVNVWYKANTVKLTDGKINTKDYNLTYSGMVNTASKAVGLDLDMVLAEKHQKSIRSGREKNTGKVVKGPVAKYVKPEKITDLAMKQLVNKEGKVYMKFKVTGTMSKPNVDMVAPALKSLTDLVKDAGGDVKDMAKDAAKEAASKAAAKGADKAKDALGGKLKKKKFW